MIFLKIRCFLKKNKEKIANQLQKWLKEGKKKFPGKKIIPHV